MRAILTTYILIISYGIFAQDQILYDLDTYKRIDAEYRTTNIQPEFLFNYFNQLNSPGTNKAYFLEANGFYDDNFLVNSINQQNNRFIDIRTEFSIGTTQSVKILTDFVKEKRKYNGEKFFKTDYQIRSRLSYFSNAGGGSNSFYQVDHDIIYGLGFGYGRLEVVNEAWLGGRILEELKRGGLLLDIPSAEAMKAFFDFLGELRFERVMDPRLRDIYRIEKMVEYLEDVGWIESGSVPSFVTIYDTFRYETFLIRQSGERLEFTLLPLISSKLNWRKNFETVFQNRVRPGIAASTEYEIHRNGDLKYYTTMLLGGYVEYRDRLFIDNDSEQSLSANISFDYIYRYLPSLRTNLSIASRIYSGFVNDSGYEAVLGLESRLNYDYYFSPATRLNFNAVFLYLDDKFQVGDFQPRLTFKTGVNIVHSLR